LRKFLHQILHIDFALVCGCARLFRIFKKEIGFSD
jgi:hypothetical protein